MDDIPWWSALVSLLIGMGVTFLFFRPPSISGPISINAAPGLGDLMTDFLSYIPHVLLLFGVLADIFTMDGVYSIPSLIGLLSIPLNYVFKYVWLGVETTVGSIMNLATAGPEAAVETAAAIAAPMGRTGTKPSAMRDILPGASGQAYVGGGSTFDGCSFQGIGLNSEYAPQTLVVTATIFSYYVFDLVVNRGWEDAALTIVTFALFFGAETWAIRKCADMSDGILSKALAALVEGVAFGGTGFLAVLSLNKNQLPSAVMKKHMPKPKSLPKDAKGLVAACANLTAGAVGSVGAAAAAVNPLATAGTGAPAAAGGCPAGTTAT
jgi:hypothetical protein